MNIVSVLAGLLLFIWGIVMFLFSFGLKKNLREHPFQRRLMKLKAFIIICQVIAVVMMIVSIYILIG